jgi:hypothetical protein
MNQEQLIAERDALKAENERLRDALRECVDASITDFDTCCVCLGDVTKHSAGCVIECAAALLVERESTQPAPDQKGKL